MPKCDFSLCNLSSNNFFCLNYHLHYDRPIIYILSLDLSLRPNCPVASLLVHWATSKISQWSMSNTELVMLLSPRLYVKPVPYLSDGCRHSSHPWQPFPKPSYSVCHSVSCGPFLLNVLTSSTSSHLLGLIRTKLPPSFTRTYCITYQPFLLHLFCLLLPIISRSRRNVFKMQICLGHCHSLSPSMALYCCYDLKKKILRRPASPLWLDLCIAFPWQSVLQP